MSENQRGRVQTLSRGIRMLEALAESESPMSIARLADVLSLHRSVAYRIVRTLEDDGLVSRDATGAYRPGARLATLARGVARDLQTAALPELTAVANELQMTAFLAVPDRTEVITLVSVEPRDAHAAVAQHPGSRHSLAIGAPGLAIQAILSPADSDRLGPLRRPEADEVRAVGYAHSHDEVIQGLRAVSAPLEVPGQSPAALAVVYLGRDADRALLGRRLVQAAAAVRQSMH